MTPDDAILRDPVLFARGAALVTPRQWQYRCLDEIAKQVRAGQDHIRVHVRTCHTAGKSWLAALLFLWWQRRKEARSVTTAPTQRQVTNLLWTNIRRIWHGMDPQYRIGHIADVRPEFAVDRKRGWGGLGFSSDEPFNLEGEHSPTAAQLIIDEAKGVPEGIRNALQGILHAPQSMLVVMSTPWVEGDWFYRMDVNGGSDLIRCVVTIDDLIAEDIPGASQAKADYAQLFGGEETPEYRSRAMAQYISSSPFGEARADCVDACMEMEPRWSGRRVVALDVARGDVGDESHDESCIALAQGDDIVEIIPFRTRDLVTCARRAVQAAQEFEADVIRPDANGIGAGPTDIIRAEGWQPHRVEEFVAQARPWDTNRFADRATESAWKLIERINARQCALPKDSELRRQILQVQFVPIAGGKIKLEKRPRGLGGRPRSPDRFDACVMATASESKSMGGSGMLSWLQSERRRAHVQAAQS